MTDQKQENTGSGYSYAGAGVDIDAGDALVDAIKPLAAATRRAGADADLGGFGGLFDLKAAGFRDPVLVAATDGVGTKLKVAFAMNRFDTIGIDLVAMCVNDLVVQGAEPLLFLDYFATGKLSVDTGKAVVAGIADGCKQAGCALLGGETAEMPGMYAAGEFDLAGFAVGAAERDTLLNGSSIRPGDMILGLASTGFHSNGYSLVRQLIEDNDINYSDRCEFADYGTIGEAVLAPTRIYVKPLLAAHAQGLVKGLAHITGGGLIENIPRILPEGTRAVMDAGAWDLPGLFRWLRDLGDISAREMLRTFNCGIGMAIITAPETAATLTTLLTEAGETVIPLGEIGDGNGDPLAEISAAPGTWGYKAAFCIRTGEDA